jgi:hypothetical protein
MSDIEAMRAALEVLRGKEAVMLPERLRLRQEFFEARDRRREHSAEFKLVRDARAELEARIREASDPRPVSGQVDALIQSVTAEAGSGAHAPGREV